MIAMQTSDRNGALVGAVLVEDHDEIMLITSGGVLVRTRVDEISVIGRNTQGVKVIRLDSGEKVVGVDKIDGLVDDEDLGEPTDSENEALEVDENPNNDSEE